jgi:hypothetical protein
VAVIAANALRRVQFSNQLAVLGAGAEFDLRSPYLKVGIVALARISRERCRLVAYLRCLIDSPVGKSPDRMESWAMIVAA